MNTTYKYSAKLLVVLFISTLISCEKSFLEILPKGQVIATKTTDYDLLLNNLDLVNIGADAQILMGDEVAAVDPFWTGRGFRDKQLFKWEGDLYNSDENAKETLVPVKNLYMYNKIISEVMTSTEGAEQVKISLQGEAYGGRAWANFLLVNYYGKPYNAATAATDPGFPIMTEADVNGTDFRRASVQEVYDLIISDLEKAIAQVESAGVNHRIRMSKATAQGLLGKVYMFMGKFDLALPLLTSAIDKLPGSLVKTELYNFNVTYPGAPTAPNDQENVYAKGISNAYTGSANTGFMMTPEASALYGSTDVRLQRWFVKTTLTNGTVLLRRTGALTAFYGLRVPDLILLRAETRARLDDLTGAVADVEWLRRNRMPAAAVPVPTAIASAKLPLINFILEERIREFPLQGYRWFDMRRLSADPLFANKTYQHRVYSPAGAVTETFTLNPVRFALKMPPKVLSENPNMQDNP